MTIKPTMIECKDMYNYAITGNTVSLLQKISSGLNPDCHNLYSNSDSPLHGATMYGKLNSVQTLLQNGANVNYRSGNGETPLIAAAQSGDMTIFNYLMDYNPNPNIAGNSGLTPLLIASPTNNVEIVTRLIGIGANVMHQMVTGESALHLAASGRATDVIRILITENPDVVNLLATNGKSALEYHIINGYSYPAQLKVEAMAAQPNASQNVINTKIHLDNTLATMKLLLENGTPCSQACYDRLFQNPDLKAAADLYGVTHDSITVDIN